MRTVRILDDNIWVGTLADADDLKLATTERVKWMGDGHQLYRALE
jgi:hypothetical protein